MEAGWLKAFEVAREAFPKLNPEEAAVGRGVRYSASSHRFELEFLGLPVTATWPAARNHASAFHVEAEMPLARALGEAWLTGGDLCAGTGPNVRLFWIWSPERLIMN